MQELLVLGLIPGTDIQITFAIWLTLIVSIVGVLAASIAKRRNLIRNLAVTILLMQQTRHLQA